MSKPRAWLCEYRSGEEFVSLAAEPLNDPDVQSKAPLYDQAALDAEVAAERERMQALLNLQQASYEREIALEVQAERERWGALAAHDARNEHRQWVTVSAWLYPGDRICIVESERSDEARAALPGLELMP
jgi:hypothetical protein